MHRSRAKLVPQFKASLQPSGVLELLVYEEIGENYWTGGGVTAKSVKQSLDAAGNYDSVTLRINSPGGDAFEGAAIYSLLKASGKPVNVFVDGIAASAASIIAMAGDRITMSNVGMLMVHNAWSLCIGDGDDMRKCADTLDKVSASIAQAYVAKTGKTAEEIKTIMDAESWMGAQECVDEGFATAIAAPAEKDEEAMALASSFRSLAKMKKVPANLAPRADDDEIDELCGCPCGPCQGGNCEGCMTADCSYEDCDHGVVAESNLSLYEARLKLLTHAK